MSYDKTISADLYDQKWEDGTITITMKRGASVPVIIIKVTGAELTGSYTLSVKADARAAMCQLGQICPPMRMQRRSAPMPWAYAGGLISGTGPAALKPGGGATRAQAAAILVRFCTGAA